jgi:iron(III) transport system ATP-binding protein
VIRVEGLQKRYDERGTEVGGVRDISFEIERGSLVTLLGPSGCGKTTTLRLIAGLERPSQGEIYIDDECMASVRSKTFVPTYRRPIGMVFQSYAIWPHMTVAGNVAFPLKVRRTRLSKTEMSERITEALALVGLAGMQERPATDLSGGQQQRVALARALVHRPKVLLLDEPLSNLDAELRERMRDEIREVQQRLGITTVFVTHDQSEALALSDRLIVMSDGLVVESGLPQQIYNFPRRSFTAEFLGMSNTFWGTVEHSSAEQTVVSTAHGQVTGRAPHGVKVGDRALVAVRPDDFAIYRRKPEGPAWRGTVRVGTYRGDSWTYQVDVNGETVKVRATREKIGMSHGDEVYLVPETGAGVITYDGPDDPEGEAIAGADLTTVDLGGNDDGHR